MIRLAATPFLDARQQSVRRRHAAGRAAVPALCGYLSLQGLPDFRVTHEDRAPAPPPTRCCRLAAPMRSFRPRPCRGATKARRSRRWCRGALPAPAHGELDLQSSMSRRVDDRPSKACRRGLRATVDLQCRARPIEKESRTDASLWVGRRSPGTRWRSGCARHPPRGDPQGSSPSTIANGPAISAEYDVPTDDACLIRATTMETIHEAHADR